MSFKDSRQPLHRVLAFAGVALTVVLNAQYAAAVKTPALQDTVRTTSEAVTKPSQDPDGMDQLRKSIKHLTVKVERLAQRVAALEKERLFDVTRVLLVGEEQRAELLQSRLRENSDRVVASQIRLEQVDHQLRPENIERLFIGVGLVRPEEARDTVRRKLGLERQALLAQLEMLRQERNRFQAALATADVAMQRLRIRLSETGRP